ncbi:MAG: hypothetical protein U1E28_20855 [Beijerinckiaceae bacterium]
MSAARQLIADAHREGASFHLVGDRLRLVPDSGLDLSPALVERAKALRSEVIAVLSPPSKTADPATPPDSLSKMAARKNRDAQRAGLTDRWCSCGAMASLAWPIGDRREAWRCLECSPVGGEA